MARARTKTTLRKPAASVKPLNGKRTHVQPPKITREGLIAAMGGVLDAVDKALPKMPAPQWAWAGTGPLRELREKMGDLITDMQKLLGEASDESADDIFSLAYATEPGTVPRASRPGMFVEWIGYVPVLVDWGGFIHRNADLHAVDPNELWISESGYRGLHIAPDALRDGDVRGWVRATLASAAQHKEFDLRKLNGWAVTKATERLAGQEWLRATLKRGPVDPIPLPRKLAAVQQSLI